MSFEVHITAPKGFRKPNLRELYLYRDLFWFLVWRNIRIRYAQSALGVGWAVIQPLCSMLIFTVIFGNLARIESDGIPYPLFSLAGLVPWTFFSNSLIEGTQSLVTNANMIRKVYFPRLALPLSTVLAKLVDFVIALFVLGGLMLWYQVAPPKTVLLLPWLIVMMVSFAAGVCFWLSALAIQFRDINYGMSFLVQLLMYAAPIVYPTSLIPEPYRLVYAVNPMVGIVEGMRAALLGTPFPISYVGIGTVTSLLAAVSGVWFFRQRERVFADVA